MTISPLLSIITVVKNSPDHLKRTINSIIPFKNNEIEYVVVDGASVDGTCAVIESYKDFIDVCVSETDEGVYDAMNKGVALAHGKYLLFLNAGDELLIDIIPIIKAAPEKTVMIYGRANMINPDGSFDYIKGKRLKSIRRFLKGMPLCHQAILYRREQMMLYDLSFKVISDRVLTYKLLKKYGLKRSFFANNIMVTYYQDGFSGSFTDDFLAAEDARFYRSVGKSYYIALKRFNFMFKHKIKRPILRALNIKY